MKYMKWAFLFTMVIYSFSSCEDDFNPNDFEDEYPLVDSTEVYPPYPIDPDSTEIYPPGTNYPIDSTEVFPPEPIDSTGLYPTGPDCPIDSTEVYPPGTNYPVDSTEIYPPEPINPVDSTEVYPPDPTYPDSTNLGG